MNPIPPPPAARNGHVPRPKAGGALAAFLIPPPTARVPHPGPPGAGDAEVANRLYGEAAVLLRRLGRLTHALAAAGHDLQGGYAVARERLRAAEGALRGALAALPDPPFALGDADDPRVRRAAEDSPPMIVGALRVSPSSGRAWWAGQELRLSAKEFDLLATLADAPTRLYTKVELLRAVWGWSVTSAGRTRTLDSHASRLRRRLVGAGAPEGQWIVNRRTRGYAPRVPAPPSEGAHA